MMNQDFRAPQALRLPTRPGRAEEARNIGISDQHPNGAAWQPVPAGAPTGLGHLADVPSRPSLGHPGDRLHPGQDGRPQDPLFLVRIELHTRQVRLVGVTDHPNELWVVQRAREFSMNRERGSGWVTSAPRFLVRDRDSKVTRAFDDVFACDGIRTITTPIQAPNANAFAERWVRTVRQECLDWMLIWSRRHLERVLNEYVRHYNDERPHRGLQLRPPSGTESESTPTPSVVAVADRVRRRDRLGVWFTSTTGSRHDVRVSEPNGLWAPLSTKREPRLVRFVEPPPGFAKDRWITGKPRSAPGLLVLIRRRSPSSGGLAFVGWPRGTLSVLPSGLERGDDMTEPWDGHPDSLLIPHSLREADLGTIELRPVAGPQQPGAVRSAPTGSARWTAEAEAPRHTRRPPPPRSPSESSSNIMTNL